jgi:heat shock protein HslJ
MKKLTVLIGFLLIAAVLTSGCATQPLVPPVTPAPAPATLTVTTAPQAPAVPQKFFGKWILTIMAVQNGTVLLSPTTEITLVFNPDGNLTGYGGCNNYFASYTLTGSATKFGYGITLGPLAATKKYCEINGPQETTYLQVLQNTMAYTVNVNQLTLTDASGNVLVFTWSVPTPTPLSYRFPV